MNRKPPLQRLSALMLVAALPTLSGMLPILDLMVGDGKAAIEAEHHPGTHGFPHNHLLCIQHQASQWVPACEAPLLPVLATLELPAVPGSNPLFRSDQIFFPRARAPPSA